MEESLKVEGWDPSEVKIDEEVVKQEPKGNKKWIYIGVAALLVLILGGGASYFILNGDDESDYVADPVAVEQPISYTIGGEVAFIDGTVEFRDEEAIEWSAAEVGTQIEEGLSIRVGTDGRAIVNLDDGSAVRVNVNSQVTFTSLSSEKIVVTNDSGELYTRVAKLDRDFIVRTDNAGFLSLGTAFKTINKVADEGVVVYESKVQVNDDQIVEEGYSASIKDDGEIDEKGVVEIDKDKVLEDEFIEWNKSQDEVLGEELGVLGDKEAPDVKEEAKEEEKVVDKEPEVIKPEPKVEEVQPTPAPALPSAINLNSVSSPSKGKVDVSWSIQNLDASKGLKVVFNTAGSPTYGVDQSLYVGNQAQTSAYISNLKEGVYYVRVCVYTGSGCTNYSNQLSVEVEGEEEVIVVDSITLSYDEVNKLSWSTGNGSVGHGFKVVKSEVSGPTYPANSIQYTKSLSTVIDGNGYYRVCAWNGEGGCDAYSNEVYVDSFTE